MQGEELSTKILDVIHHVSDGQFVFVGHLVHYLLLCICFKRYANTPVGGGMAARPGCEVY